MRRHDADAVERQQPSGTTKVLWANLLGLSDFPVAFILQSCHGLLSAF
jgi:hypothetical protein